MCATYARLPKRILIVDDDLDLLMLLERRLEKEGYLVETAASLTEAEEILSVFAPGLVLVDINVNGEDGRQLCWKIKTAHFKNVPKIVVISGFDYSTGRALLFGADELLPKPFHMDFLLHRVAAYVGTVEREAAGSKK